MPRFCEKSCTMGLAQNEMVATKKRCLGRMYFKIVNFLFVFVFYFRCYIFDGMFDSFCFMLPEFSQFLQEAETRIEIIYQTTHRCVCVF